MSSILWIGTVVIVSILELIRISMSSYVLLHILESYALLRHGEEPGQGTRSLRSAPARAHRESLLAPTLLALRGAMDEVARGRPGPHVERAIAALDDYAAALTGMRELERKQEQQ